MFNGSGDVSSNIPHNMIKFALNCTFCDILETPEEQNETPLHLFFSVLPLNTYRTTSFLGCLKARSRLPDKSYSLFSIVLILEIMIY
jgi:hypothetical protein